MFEQKLDELSKKLFASLPEGIKAIDHDIKSQFKSILQSAFAQLDMVSREEFDVQVKVLARTREKVDRLEALLAAKNTLPQTPSSD